MRERVRRVVRDVTTRRKGAATWRCYRVSFDPTSDIGRSLRTRGRFEEREIDLALAFLLALYPGRSVIDVGANIGLHSLAWAPFAPIIAVEPAPTTVERLRLNISTNGLDDRIQLIQAAVGESTGEVEFFVTDDDAFSGLKDTGRKTVVSRLRVPCTTLDALADTASTRVGLVKIDVEGFEQAVVSGGREMLRRDAPILFVEIYGGTNSNPDPTGTIEEIVDLGYEPFVFSEARGLRAYTEHSDSEYNYFFLPRARGNADE